MHWCVRMVVDDVQKIVATYLQLVCDANHTALLQTYRMQPTGMLVVMNINITTRWAAGLGFALLWALIFVPSNASAQSLVKDETQTTPTGKSAAPLRIADPQSASLTDPVAAFRAAKLIYVRSTSLLVRPAVIEEQLRKRSEFGKLGLLITRDITAADLILEVKHDLFTMYVYSAVEPKTNVVVAGGKLSSLGGTVAGKVAKRFLKQLVQARQI